MYDDFPHPITPYPKLIINAALTGMVGSKRNNPGLPVCVDEIIGDAAVCHEAGASVVHVHARDDDGEPSYRKDIYARIIEGIRTRCPGLLICASTSGRVHNTLETRSEVLSLEGGLRPDFGSLTLGSFNFPTQTSVNTVEMIEALALRMKESGIRPELEVFEPGMINTARVLLKRGLLERPCYFNILLGSRYSAPATLPELAHMVQSLPAGSVWGATGIGQFQLIINMAAVLMGGHVRVGLEDNIYYDLKRKRLATNRMLVERIARFAEELGREVATPEDARKMLGISA